MGLDEALAPSSEDEKDDYIRKNSSLPTFFSTLTQLLTYVLNSRNDNWAEERLPTKDEVETVGPETDTDEKTSWSDLRP